MSGLHLEKIEIQELIFKQIPNGVCLILPMTFQAGTYWSKNRLLRCNFLPTVQNDIYIVVRLFNNEKRPYDNTSAATNDFLLATFFFFPANSREFKNCFLIFFSIASCRHEKNFEIFFLLAKEEEILLLIKFSFLAFCCVARMAHSSHSSRLG